jgi:hypothetical protein
LSEKKSYLLVLSKYMFWVEWVCDSACIHCQIGNKKQVFTYSSSTDKPGIAATATIEFTAIDNGDVSAAFPLSDKKILF